MFDVQKITNRNEFVGYCLRSLGSPVIKINVDNTQIEDRINDALKMFFDYHVDGSEKAYIVHELTQEDIDNQAVTIPDNVLVVTNAISGVGATTSMSRSLTNNIQVKAYFTDVISRFSMHGVSNYILTKSYLNTFTDVLNGKYTIIEHNYYKQKLKLFFDWSAYSVGDVIAYECWVANDVDAVFGDYWLQQYATALIQRQWGKNLIKVDGMTLPGGGRLNGSEILNQANAEIEKLEERMRDEFSYPVMPFMG